MKQISFGFLKDYKKEFGGSLLKGKRKSRRPLSTKAPIHLILKAERKSVFSPGSRHLEKIIHQTARKFQVQIYDLALNWSHIHLLIRIHDRQDYVKFIRALSSLLSRAVQAKSNRPQPGTLPAKIFALRPFSRILNWGRDFKYALEYLTLNQMEAFALIQRFPKQKEKLKAKGQSPSSLIRDS